MIELKNNIFNAEGSDFELYADLVVLHSVIIQEPQLMKLDQMAMEAVKTAIKEGKLDQIAKRLMSGENISEDDNR